MMERPLVGTALFSCSLLAATSALAATTYYASSDGNGDGTSADSPSSVSSAVDKAQPGDTVYLRGGTYTGWGGAIHPVRSGTESAWITFEALPGELPIFEGSGVGGGTYEYIRYIGLVSRGGSSGFGNGWTDGSCSTMSNSNLEYINCVADGNDINGIAHYCASGLHIKQSIVAHNGAQDPSWSSGVNLFAVKGSASDNVVEQTISFENIDISTNHTDGSGFIVDQNSTGATFVNNIGFHNGGSCIRLTNSTNTQIINNTCVHNGLDPSAKYHDEIFFSDTNTTHQGALLRNNLCIPTSGQQGLTMGNGVPAENNNFEGTDSMVVSATGDLDFHLVEGSAAIDAAAAGAPTPSDEIGFDWRCIKQQSGQAISWWNYAVDYDYIESIGGVAACFQAGTRTGTPDQGAYEYGASAPSTGGAAGTGGATDATGGVNAAAGATGTTGGDGGTGGNGGTGGDEGTGGTSVAAGGTSVATGGRDTATGGRVSAETGGVDGAGASDSGGTSSGGVTGQAGALGGAGATAGGSTTAPVAACQEPLLQCGTSCVDIDSDPLHCGGCDLACASGEVCSSRACASDCDPGTEPCDRACVDPVTDVLHCGACGNACQKGQTCEEGSCAGTPTGGSVAVPEAAPDENPMATQVQDSGCACSSGRRGASLGWVALLLGLLGGVSMRRNRRPAKA